MNANRIEWGRAALCLICVKAFYFLLLFLALHWWGDPSEFANRSQRWPLNGGPTFASHFTGWDSGFYLSLSKYGYNQGDNACAFYPLWPILICWFSVIIGSDPLISGMLLANLFSLTGWILFYGVTAKRFGKQVAVRAVGIMVIFPGSMFYQFAYSESLFLVLLMLLWMALESRRSSDYGLAWGAAFLLPLSRGVGLFAIVPLVWDALMRLPLRWLDRLPWIRLERARFRANALYSVDVANRSWLAFGVIVAPVLGWSLYLVLMNMWTGNPFEGVEAQKYWGVHSISNLWNVPKFVVAFFSPTSWHEFNGSLLDRCMFLVLLYSLPIIWRLGRDLFSWAFVLGVLPAMSGGFVSFTRFESVVFPLFIAIAVYFGGQKKKLPFVLFAMGSVLLHVILLWRFVSCRWAG